MSCCCQNEPSEPEEQNCCEAKETSCCDGGRKFDWLLWGSLIGIILACIGYWTGFERTLGFARVSEFSHGIRTMLAAMWWGILGGIIAVGVMHQVPREAVMKVMGRPGTAGGILRAVGGGIVLDLCNHGILLVAMKLYERGASLGQVFAFLIASPWNSFSLTLILVSLIGIPLTLLFIICSMGIAIVAGLLVEKVFVRPDESQALSPSEQLEWPEVWQLTCQAFPSRAKIVPVVLRDGMKESRMILRWVFFGIVLASAIRALFDPSTFQEWFGPSLAGLLLTLLGATVIEVCSEGSTPISADLVNRAAAPGNGFVFLMAGAATDYTEIMALKETTGRWWKALLLPAVTVPQVLVVGYLINVLGG